MEVAALPFDFLVLLDNLRLDFLTVLAALLTPSEFTLFPAQRRFCLAEELGVLAQVAVRVYIERLNTYIYAGFLASERQGLCRHLGTGEHHIPPIRFFGERDGLGRAFQRTGPAHGDTANLAENQKAIIQPCAVAVFLVGEGVVTVTSLKTRVAWLLTTFTRRKKA